MLENVTPAKCVEFAIKTEEIGAELYHQFAQRFASDRELTELFRDLGRDEVQHAEQFRALRDRFVDRPQRGPVSADEANYLRAMSMSDIFSGPKGLASTLDGIRTRDDALERSLHLEKATLAYYQALRDVLGADDVLDALALASESAPAS